MLSRTPAPCFAACVSLIQSRLQWRRSSIRPTFAVSSTNSSWQASSNTVSAAGSRRASAAASIIRSAGAIARELDRLSFACKIFLVSTGMERTIQ